MAGTQLVQSVALVLYQGQPFATQLILRDASGALQDLTGQTAHVQVRTAASDATAQADWSSADGTIVVGGAAGTVTFAVDATATAALATRNVTCNWVADLFLTDVSAIPQKVAAISLQIVPAVTRA